MRAVEAVRLLQELIIAYDRRLDPRPSERSSERLVTVTFTINTPLPNVQEIRGVAKVDDNRVVFSTTDDMDALVRLFVKTGGRCTIELDCDLLLDEVGQPVSSHSGPLRGFPGNRPGGVLRLYLEVERGQ